jgi:L-ascorbate metabolism protein UlaG (beta-lactamase superfamily)
MRLRLIRHATLLLEYAGRKLLIDPMLDEAGARPAIENSPNQRKNPLVSLPVTAQEVVDGIDAVLVTHTHSDHWDSSASGILPKDLPLYGQPEDEQKLLSQGFKNVRPISTHAQWQGIEIARTSGQHGTREIGRAMAPVSGFVLRARGEPTLYIAGDTIWCDDVAWAIKTFNPGLIVVNAGAAQFLEGDAITMTADDVIRTAQAAPAARVIAVHMEAINHCLLSRADLAFQLESARVAHQVAMPQDGEWVRIKDK